MVDLKKLSAQNVARWNKAKLTRPFNSVADRLVAARSRYRAVAAKTGVPWFVIAVIHERESSGSFAGVLHNGQKIIGTGRKTTIVPKGRGPFASWEDAATDALVNCHPYAARNKDWSIGGTLLLLEQYNGLGYATKGVPSPYLWAGTDQYVAGKYVRDGVYDASAVDKQLGCAGLLKAMMAMDGSIAFADASAPAVAEKPPPDPAPASQPASPQPSVWTAFFLRVGKLFKRA